MSSTIRIISIFTTLLFSVSSEMYAQQSTSGYCSPAISNVNGNVTTNCFQTKAEWRQSITDNLQEAIFEARRLSSSQRFYLMPTIDSYIDNPSQATWNTAKLDVDLVRQKLALTIDAVITYDGSLQQGLGPDLAELHDALHHRAGLLSSLPNEPPSQDFMREWAQKYRQQMARLSAQLNALEERLHASSTP